MKDKDITKDLKDLNELRSKDINDLKKGMFKLSKDNMNKKQVKLNSLSDNLNVGLDGLILNCDIDISTKKTLIEIIKPYILNPKEIKMILNYQKIYSLAVKENLVTNKYSTDKIIYRFNIVKNRQYNPFKQSGDEMILDQSVTISINGKYDIKKGLYYEFKLWINPNKFLKDTKLQELEPLIWFTKKYIYPHLAKVRIEEIHLNQDFGCSYNDFKVYKDKTIVKGKQVLEKSKYTFSKYLNNCLQIYDYNKHKRSFYGNFDSTLIIYNKSAEISNKVCKSYINKSELDSLSKKGINVTRMELRSYTTEQSAAILKSDCLLSDRYSIFYYYKDENGYVKHKRVKNLLNRQYKKGRDLVKNFALVNDEIIKNTLNFNNHKKAI